MNFETTKKIVGMICWISIAIFTFVSLLAIWKVINNNDVIWRSFTSIGIIFFSSLVILIILSILGTQKK